MQSLIAMRGGHGHLRIYIILGGEANAILGHVHLENPKMALENMALNSLKWPLNQKY